VGFVAARGGRACPIDRNPGSIATVFEVSAGDKTEKIDLSRGETKIKPRLGPGPTLIPENRHGVKPGFYTRPDIARLLRLHAGYPHRICFIADMME
jgi:hypothetical protein